MSWTKFLPLRFILRQAARSQGFLDPLELMARLRSLAQPSEVSEPIELLRAGVVFHARGLINSRVIQYNLDWLWPYWVQRQYDPRDVSFMPRAFSVSHINLTHRNWTAIGYPDCGTLPIVDPRGLLTPFHDGWSLDAWLLERDGEALLPSMTHHCRQTLSVDGTLRVETANRCGPLSLTTDSRVDLDGGTPVCRLRILAQAGRRSRLVVALRPCNPEGISFIHDLSLHRDGQLWIVNGAQRIEFNPVPSTCRMSDYNSGDVFLHLERGESRQSAHCAAGLLSAAALYDLAAGETAAVEVDVPLAAGDAQAPDPRAWQTLLAGAARLSCPDEKYTALYNSAVASLILHSPDDVFPGPYTYKRFWFRDAAFMLHALLCIGLVERAERALGRFPQRQTTMGFFRSQEGEWDSNGEVLWILHRFRELTGRMPRGDWRRAILRGARWIVRKRIDDGTGEIHSGLMPAGFSAEHLGPNDYYYWDSFWSLSGLRCAVELLDGSPCKERDGFADTADSLEQSVVRSLREAEQRLGHPGMPASPYRRMDAGAIGSLAASYPLQLWDPGDRRVTGCVDYLLENCLVQGLFFQDMIHSGLNPYLTLHIAQVLLRNRDARFLELVDRVADAASPTGQWPEAIHPITHGGCMGDGHHAWASAEWILIIRNSFVREERGRLLLCTGIPARWLQSHSEIRFGPALTAFGEVVITVNPGEDGNCLVACDGRWRGRRPPIEAHLHGFPPCQFPDGTDRVTLRRDHAAKRSR